LKENKNKKIINKSNISKIEKKQQAPSKQQKRIAITIIIFIAALYILYVIFLLNKDDTSIIFVEQGTIHKEETVVGYILRNEKVIKNEEYQNGIITIAGEGEKVYKNEAVFQYYSDEAKELSKQITELDLQIQEKIENEKITYNSDIKLIETQIEEILEEIRNINNTQEITEYNKSIKNLLEKKRLMLGEISGASDELKALIKQREQINGQISNSAKYLTAPISGVISYRVDGLEEELTTDDFTKLNREYLEGLNLKTGHMIATSGEVGKVIDNFSYYIATAMDSEEAINAKIGDKVKVRLSTNDEVQAKIVHINEEQSGRVLILKIDRLTEKLINYRKISFDVIWWSDSGLKVPNKAIVKDEAGLAYVVRNRLGYLSKLLVKVVNSNDNYSIVSTYNSEELTNLGVTQEEISNYKKIKLYDEVLLNPSLENLE